MSAIPANERAALALHPKQRVGFWTRATEILYGGAVAGGKSHLMRVAAILWCIYIPGLQVYLFRRVFEDLVKNHIEGPKGFRALLAPLVNEKKVAIVEDEIRFYNGPNGTVGSKIFLCHCKDPKHVYKYQGAEIHVLMIDEITHWFEDMYRFLRQRVRAPGLVIPQAFLDMFPGITFPRILCSGNPGNVGHQWVKATWISPRRPLQKEQMGKSEGGMLRQFIPAKLEDNPTMLEDDPGYGDRVEGLGSKELVRAMKEGDWDIVAGAFFDNWRHDLHVIPRWTPPKQWTRYRSIDWGSYRPFSVGWYAIADEDTWVPVLDNIERKIQRGSIVRYREWYGVKYDDDGQLKANVGLKLSIESLADGILKREFEAGETVDGQLSVADPSMWKEDGGPSLIERLCSYKPKEWDKNNVVDCMIVQPADNTRETGWQQCRARLDGEDGHPDFFVTEDCIHFIRTVPVLQHDEHKVEDLDSDSEDHVSDEWRYACMARPVSRVKKPKPAGLKPWSYDWIIQQDKKRTHARV